MGSRVVPTTATPDPRWFTTNEGTGRSTVRSQAIVKSAGRQIRQASKETIKSEQSRSNPPTGVPRANLHNTWALARQWRYSWPIANWEQRYTTYLQREIRTVPMGSENGGTRLGDRGLLRARAGVTARAAGVTKGRRSVPIWKGWRFAGFGRNCPITHARACVAGSLICGSDRRLRVGMPAQAVPCVWVRGCGGGCGRQGQDPCSRRRVEQHVLEWPSSVRCGASFVGIWLPRRQGESRDAGSC